MNIFERLIYDPPRGTLREFEGINTYFEPRDLALYRKLLPEQFAMPRHPLVTIFFADYIRVESWPFIHYRYLEWSAMLRSSWKGEEGWHCLTIPVSKWVAMVAGRYMGFPKYIADKIILTKSGEIWNASAEYKGLENAALEFCPGLTRQLTSWEKEQLDCESLFGNEIVHLLVPPGRGPRAQKVVLCHMVPPTWSPRVGMVRVRVHPSESWAGLVPDAGVFPGTYNRFTGGINLIAVR